MESGDIWTGYFISDIKEDKKLDKVIAFEGKLIAESFINIIEEATENIFKIKFIAIQTHFQFIRDEFKFQRLTDVLKKEFKLDKVKAKIKDEVLGFRVTGQNTNIRVIQADVQNGRQGDKSFVFDSVDWVLKRLIIKRIKIDWYEDKFFRWFDSEIAKKIIEVENQWGNSNFKYIRLI